MNEAGHVFFNKQLSLQKRGIIYFPLAVLFLGTMTYLRAGNSIPLYAIPIPLLILINGFILNPLAGARSSRKTISAYEISAKGDLCFTCYNPLWSAVKIYNVNVEYLQWTSNEAIGKKNIYKIDPTIRITNTQTHESFYYFPIYFDDNSYLTSQFKEM